MPTKKPRLRKKLWLRIVLGILRFLLVPALCICALFIGLVVGYVRLGGQPYAEVFHVQTWKHIFELVYSST
ncbi:MAG: hypothetical protein JWM44_1368 [Bacilli bacterium]|nr:hypothetical protein [Bacilli bacterium]